MHLLLNKILYPLKSILFAGFPINQSHHLGEPEVVITQNLLMFLNLPTAIRFLPGGIWKATSGSHTLSSQPFNKAGGPYIQVGKTKINVGSLAS